MAASRQGVQEPCLGEVCCLFSETCPWLVPPCFFRLSSGSRSSVAQPVPVFHLACFGRRCRDESVSKDLLCIEYLIAALADPQGYITKSVLMILT